MKKSYAFKKICHTQCFKFDTLWKPGDIYEGNDDPGKWFSEDGTPEAPNAPQISTDDPRSTDQLIRDLKNKFGVTMPKTRGRKIIWAKLHDLETQASQDENTQDLAPEKEVKITPIRKRGPKKKE